MIVQACRRGILVDRPNANKVRQPAGGYNVTVELVLSGSADDKSSELALAGPSTGRIASICPTKHTDILDHPGM